jgi:cell division protein ZapA (FtsZ GTPase activity inhibitor)
MSDNPEYLNLTICGQSFRLRCDAVDTARAQRVAAEIEKQVEKHRARGAISELRAILMACYQFGYELDETLSNIESVKQSEKRVTNVSKKMDQLLAKIDREMEPVRKQHLIQSIRKNKK